MIHTDLSISRCHEGSSHRIVRLIRNGKRVRGAEEETPQLLVCLLSQSIPGPAWCTVSHGVCHQLAVTVFLSIYDCPSESFHLQQDLI
jgi:hypothetical protein